MPGMDENEYLIKSQAARTMVIGGTVLDKKTLNKCSIGEAFEMSEV